MTRFHIAAFLWALQMLAVAPAATPPPPLVLDALTPAQVQSLALTAKVWGFLKYHHPELTGGGHDWDLELLEHLPALLAARTPAAAQKELLTWLDSLGPVADCAPCTRLEGDSIQSRPRLAWLADRRLLGAKLSGRLQAIYRNRSGRQGYVTLAPNIGNPVFDAEPAYAELQLPDAGYQILALLRYWNVIEYWFPYRDLIDENWDAVLRDALPRVALARDATTYQRELMALIARADDGHATLGSSMRLREPMGDCLLPVTLRYLEGQFVVDGFMSDTPEAQVFQPGDVLTSIDGEPLADLVSRIGRYYGASNESARMTGLARAMTRGACALARVGVKRDAETPLEVHRLPMRVLRFDGMLRHDLAGDTFRMLTPEIAYLKLSTIKVAEVAGYIQQAATARALIVDLRNYPSEFVVFALGSLLVDESTPFVIFTVGDLSNPGAFRWGSPLNLTPAQPQYAGKVAILVDGVTISSAEYHAMALRAGPRAILVGAQTAGADGNVSAIPLPGGLRANMSGLGVFYPDRRPTQRRGLALDVPCPETIAGVRAGRDEILECARRALAAAP